MPSKKTTRTRKTKKQSQDCSITAGFQMVIGFLEKQYKSGHVATLDDAENKIVDKFLDTMEKHLDWANSKQIELVDKKMAVIFKHKPTHTPNDTTPLVKKLDRTGLKQFICRIYPKGGFQLGGSPNDVALREELEEYRHIVSKIDLGMMCNFLYGMFLIITSIIILYTKYSKYYTLLTENDDYINMDEAKQALTSLLELGYSKNIFNIIFNTSETLLHCGKTFGPKFADFFVKTSTEIVSTCASRHIEQSTVFNTSNAIPDSNDGILSFLYYIGYDFFKNMVNVGSIAARAQETTDPTKCFKDQSKLYYDQHIKPDVEHLTKEVLLLKTAVLTYIFPSTWYFIRRMYPGISELVAPYIEGNFDLYGNELIEHSKSKGRRRKMRRTRKLK